MSLLQSSYSRIGDDFGEALQEFTISYLLEQPLDVIEYGVEFFRRLLQRRLTTRSESQPAGDLETEETSCLEVKGDESVGGSGNRVPTLSSAGRALALSTEDEPGNVQKSNGGVRIVEVPPKLFKVPDEPFQLWWWSEGDGASWSVGRLCGAACSRLGGAGTPLDQSSESPQPPPVANSQPPHAILLDARLKHTQHLVQFIQWMRENYGSHTYIIAVVTNTVYLKEDDYLKRLLDVGIDRILEEGGGAMRWRAEMLQAAAAARRRRGHAAGSSALLGALRVGVAAPAADSDAAPAARVARISVCGADGAVLLTAGDGSDAEAVADAPPAAPARASIDSVFGVPPLQHRISPHKWLSAWHTVMAWVLPAGGGRSSLASLRNDSAAAAAESGGGSGRRTSLMLRTSRTRLALDAPIAKASALLEAAAAAAANGAAAAAATLVTRAADALRAVDLYRTELVARAGRHTVFDPLTDDLVAGLIAQQPALEKGTHSSRRSSGNSAVARSQSKYNPELPEIQILTADIMKWEWDVFLLERASKRRPLVPAGHAIFSNFDAANTLNCDEQTLSAWLSLIESNYNTNIAYHTATHAADVMQAVAVYVERGSRVAAALGPFGTVAALLAAAAHDVGHPGTSAAFLCNSSHPLAILYNDQAVLENHHAALTFSITLNNERANVFKGLEKERYQTMRRDIVDMILATEMTNHFEHLAKFVNVFSAKTRSEIDVTESSENMEILYDNSLFEQPENVTLVKRMLIKTADVSNPARPMKICIEWASRICEEYFSQTETEKALGLPVVMPGFERTTCSVPRSQRAFYDFIIADMIDAWSGFVEMPELKVISFGNYQRWEKMEEQGVVTLQDINKAALNLKEEPNDSQMGNSATKEASEKGDIK